MSLFTWTSHRLDRFSTSLLGTTRSRLLRTPWGQYQPTGNNETPLAEDDLNSNAQGQDVPDVPDVLMPDAPAVHDIATPRRTIGGSCRKWCISAQPASGKRKCAACCSAEYGSPTVRHVSSSGVIAKPIITTNMHICVNGGLAHDHELHPKLADDQEAVDAVTRQRDTITRTAADTEVLLPLAQDPDQASAAPPDDERDFFGREEALRMDEEIMDFQWFEHVTWDSASKTYVARRMSSPPRGSGLLCSKLNMPSFEPSFTTIPPHWRQNQLGKRWCSTAGSSWDDLQLTPLRATAHTFWMRDWSFSGLMTGLLSGPWYVLNVMLLRCRTRRAERTSSRCSHVFAKLPHQLVLVKKDEPQWLPETHHQFQSQNRLSKRSRASTRRTQNHQLLCKPQCQPYSCLKWLSMSLPHSERCRGSVNQDHLACARNVGMTSALWREAATCLCK